MFVVNTLISLEYTNLNGELIVIESLEIGTAVLVPTPKDLGPGMIHKIVDIAESAVLISKEVLVGTIFNIPIEGPLTRWTDGVNEVEPFDLYNNGYVGVGDPIVSKASFSIDPSQPINVGGSTYETVYNFLTDQGKSKFHLAVSRNFQLTYKQTGFEYKKED